MAVGGGTELSGGAALTGSVEWFMCDQGTKLNLFLYHSQVNWDGKQQGAGSARAVFNNVSHPPYQCSPTQINLQQTLTGDAGDGLIETEIRLFFNCIQLHLFTVVNQYILIQGHFVMRPSHLIPSTWSFTCAVSSSSHCICCLPIIRGYLMRVSIVLLYSIYYISSYVTFLASSSS